MNIIAILLCVASGGFAIYEIISFVKMVKKNSVKSREKPPNSVNNK